MTQSSEQNTPPAENVGRRKAQWAQWETGARKWNAIASEEQQKAAAAAEFKTIGSKSNADFRRYCMENYGWDPQV